MYAVMRDKVEYRMVELSVVGAMMSLSKYSTSHSLWFWGAITSPFRGALVTWGGAAPPVVMVGGFRPFPRRLDWAA